MTNNDIVNNNGDIDFYANMFRELDLGWGLELMVDAFYKASIDKFNKDKWCLFLWIIGIVLKKKKNTYVE
jgi:hypothetical protein